MPLLVLATQLAAAPARISLDFTQRARADAWRFTHDSADPENLLALPQNSIETETRLDVALNSDLFNLTIRPRLEARRTQIRTGVQRGITNRETDLFFHEINMTVEPVQDLLFSLGRKTREWGPSWLLSPSNPFGMGRTRLDPRREPNAADFLGVDWLPNEDWSLALIAKTGRGQEPYTGDFSPVYAVKADRLYGGVHAAGIASITEGNTPVLGGFTSVHIGEAGLAHAEASWRRHTATVLGGVSYTTWWRWLLAAEYLYHGAGDAQSPVYELVTGLPPDSEALFPLRRQYLLFQALYPRWRQRIDVLMNYILNLDDHSGRGLLYTELELTTRVRLFLSATHFHGNRNSEFGSLFRHQFTGGIDVRF